MQNPVDSITDKLLDWQIQSDDKTFIIEHEAFSQDIIDGLKKLDHSSELKLPIKSVAPLLISDVYKNLFVKFQI